MGLLISQLLLYLMPSCYVAGILIKVRLFGSRYFFEMDLPSLTFQTLLGISAQETGIEMAKIHLVRKLPDVIVRDDRDVARFKEGEKIELVTSKEV